MSKKWSNRNLPGALHFVTGNVRDRKRIFDNVAECTAFLEECQLLRKKLECKLVAFVLMPDHFHLVSNPRDGDIRGWCGALKSLSAIRIVKLSAEKRFLMRDGSNKVWQESFKALPLWSNWMIWQKINYIHANPLRARLVSSTEEYRWSSFHSFYRDDPNPLLQVDKDWWWPDDVQKLEIAMDELNKEK